MKYRTYNENMDIVRQHQQEKYVNVIALAKELGINENISGSIIKNKEFGGFR